MKNILEDLLAAPSEEQCRELGLSGFAWLVVNDKGEIVRISEQCERLFGYESRRFLEGKPVEILLRESFHPTHIQYREEYTRNPTFRSMGKGRVVKGVSRDGREVSVVIALYSWWWNRKQFISAMIIEAESDTETSLDTSVILK